VTADTAFPLVIAACAESGPRRAETWINPTIERLFVALHASGHAHSVECWSGNEIVGGLYGLAIGGAFFGESMFSRARDASKVALVHLVARLRMGGFTLLDTQFVTSHLAQFGAQEVPREAYRRSLADAIDRPAVWMAEPDGNALRRSIEEMREET
jgi:leucyl/phenylalanyl-tRNA--protein transferase